MSTLDYLVFVLMLVAVIATGIVSGRRDKNASPDEEGREFFLAGKGINKLQAGFSMAATDFGGSGLIGAIGYCYVAGMSGIWLNLAAAPAFFIIGVLLARLFNCMDCATLPEYLGKRYSMAVRYIECFMHLCTNIASLCSVHRVVRGAEHNHRYQYESFARYQHGYSADPDQRRSEDGSQY